MCSVTEIRLNLMLRIKREKKRKERIKKKKIPYGLPPLRGIEHQIDFLVLHFQIRNL